MAGVLTESILTSIKKLLGIHEDDASFDNDVATHINSVFMILNQLGVGPETAFSISDKESVWSDFIPDANKIESVKTYIYLRVKLVFDPPSSSSAMESANRIISELEWRILTEAEVRRSK